MKWKLPNALPVVKKHLQRIRPSRWYAKIKDPRAETNRYWRFDYLLEVLCAGMLSGCKTLREVETLSEIYDERVSDTTLHDVLEKLDPQPLHEALVRDVKIALRSHELPRNKFPVRITAIDGKSIAVSKQSFGPNSDPVTGGGEGQFRHMALRAMHVSNEMILFLGQREIPCKGAETTELRPFVETLLANYGRTDLLEVISVDAGMVSKENADFLVRKKLHYIMALKGPQQKLFAELNSIFATMAPLKTTLERQNGKEIIRELCRFATPGLLNWQHVREAWFIKQTVTCHKTKKQTTEVRFFLSSLAPDKLSDVQVMQAIRMHWRIENNGYWLLDTAWTEDASPWTNRAMRFVSLLRLLAYNTISRLINRRLRYSGSRELSWLSVMKLLEHACCQLRQSLLAINRAQPATL